jgi:hypothetical protein
MKAHFTRESYDFFKCKGAINTSKEAFEKRNDRHRIAELSKMKDTEIRDFLLANIINDKNWSIFDAQSHHRYTKYAGYKAARKYHFGNEVRNLYAYAEKHDIMHPNIFKDMNGNCLALDVYLGGEISIDTFVILDMLYPFIDTLCQDFVKKSLCQTAIKYRPFVRVHSEDFAEIEEKIRTK